MKLKQPKTYQYKFQGQELQDELDLNVYDFGARNYDPALGRWLNIDPLAEQSRRWSPYNFAYNNPIYFVHPDGMSALGFDFDDLNLPDLEPPTDLYNTSGKKIGTDGVDNGLKIVVTDNKEARQISRIKGNVDLSNVKSGVILPSDVTLQESLNVLDRTIANGGLREESSIVMNDGTIIQG